MTLTTLDLVGATGAPGEIYINGEENTESRPSGLVRCTAAGCDRCYWWDW